MLKGGEKFGVSTRSKCEYVQWKQIQQMKNEI